MRMTWGTTITAGLTASVATVVFSMLIPQLLGMGSIDIIQNMGSAFNSQSPYFAGSIFMAMLGIVWASVFNMTYEKIPGNAILKGVIFGLFVGMFSMIILPSIMSVLDGLFGDPNGYTASAFGINNQMVVTMMAYMVFGIVMAFNLRPIESRNS